MLELVVLYLLVFVGICYFEMIIRKLKLGIAYLDAYMTINIAIIAMIYVCCFALFDSLLFVILSALAATIAYYHLLDPILKRYCPEKIYIAIKKNRENEEKQEIPEEKRNR